MSAGSRMAVLVVAGWACVSPLHASDLSGRALAPLNAFASTVGHVVASIPFCGGDAREAEQFKGYVEKMLQPFNPDVADLSSFWEIVTVAKNKAVPRGVDCTDAGGQALFGQMLSQQSEIAAALGITLDQ